MKKWVMCVAAAAMPMMSYAHAQAADPAAEAGEEESQVIVIIGQGETRQSQTIGGALFEELPPGTSPIKLVQRLPGVSFSGADTFGAYEWAARINIRGFAQQQLGFTLDGVPLGDMSYANHNGLHVSRALISENLGRVELTQGSGALDVASSSNLGGALQFFSVDPSDELGGVAAVTYGSDATLRGFARFETGELNATGTRAWLALMTSSMDKWKGEGEQNQDQIAFKIVQPIGSAELTGYFNHSERREQDYQDLSLGMIDRLGYNWDNFGLSQYALAVRVADIAHNRGDTGQPRTNIGAGTVYPAPITTADDAYLDAAGVRDDDLAYIALDAPIGEAVDVRLQVYNHHNEGQGLWGTPYLISPSALTPGATTNNAPLSIRTTEYNIDRSGVLGSITARLGAHELNAGFWTETNDFNQYRRFYALNRSAPNRGFQDFLTGPFFTQWAYTFDTQTLQLYIQDTWRITDALKVNFGAKSINVENEVETLVINNAAPGATADSNLRGSIETEENFLPQAGFTYALNDATELFASYAENAAAFPSLVGSVFASRSQTVFNETKRTVSPESSTTFEGGVRHDGASYRVGATAYLVQFDDRLLAVSQGPGIVGNAPIVSNVGAVETIGLEVVGSFDVTDNWSLFGSYTYNQSEYQDDVRNRAGTLLAATAGKTVVNTPEHLFFGEVAYENGPFSGALSANYISDRFFTYTNTGGKVDGRVLVDLTLSYKFEGNAFLDGLEAQLNVSNLFDEEYVGTLGTNGFVNSGDSQTLVAGAPQQIFATIRKVF